MIIGTISLRSKSPICCCSMFSHMQSMCRRLIWCRIGSTACRDASALRFLQSEMVTSTSVFRSRQVKVLKPLIVTLLQPWISSFSSTEQPLAIAISLESVKSAEFLMESDAKDLQSASPSSWDSIALQSVWKWPSLRDLRLGHLVVKASITIQLSLTFLQTSSLNSSINPNPPKNSIRPSAVKPASSSPS